MQTALFNYELPPHFIAQQPAEPRDSSRLLVLHRQTGQMEHRTFHDITDYLETGDLLVANNSRVMPARLHGEKPTGGKVEVFLLRKEDGEGLIWSCLVRGRKLVAGATVLLDGGQIQAEILAVHPTGTRTVQFSHPPDQIGEIPLPPYITDYVGESERYQTVYSQPAGSAAAPTAGLHFTPELLHTLHQQGVGMERVTLHVGLDTFKPVTAERVDDHEIHTEWAEVSPETAKRINQTSLEKGRIVAVGTTTTRTLEWAATGAQQIDPYDATACPWQRVAAFGGDVNLFIRPSYRFRAVDALITNFHLPKSSLLMLVSAFVEQAHPHEVDAGRRLLFTAYEEAKRMGYRFFSFGDAMLIL